MSWPRPAPAGPCVADRASLTVRTRVEVVAFAGPRGRTVLEVLRGSGSMAPRQTADGQVHLVATAAGPLGGDELCVRLVVRSGAHLRIRGVSATLALAGRDGGPSLTTVSVTVEEGAVLDVRLPPVIVSAAATVHAQAVVDVADGGALTLHEQVVLGRWREQPGRWRGRVTADLAGRAWVRQTVALGPGSATWDALHRPRALLSRLGTVGSQPLPDARSGSAVRAALAGGGWLVTAVGADLAAATRDADAVTPCDRGHGGRDGRPAAQASAGTGSSASTGASVPRR